MNIVYKVWQTIVTNIISMIFFGISEININNCDELIVSYRIREGDPGSTMTGWCWGRPDPGYFLHFEYSTDNGVTWITHLSHDALNFTNSYSTINTSINLSTSSSTFKFCPISK